MARPSAKSFLTTFSAYDVSTPKVRLALANTLLRSLPVPVKRRGSAAARREGGENGAAQGSHLQGRRESYRVLYAIHIGEAEDSILPPGGTAPMDRVRCRILTGAATPQVVRGAIYPQMTART
jgi:hypothetical protein